MGRKIPGKKHRGVKDPLKQQAKRQAELETKINAPPKNVDDQAVPKSLDRVVKLKEAVKTGKLTKIKKRKKSKNNLICVGLEKPKQLHPKAKPDKTVPVFQQRPGETSNHFLHRVSKDTQAFINETAFEKKYGVEVNRNPSTGNIVGVTKRQKDEIDELEMLKAKHKNIKKKKKVSDTPKMTKNQKKKEKLRLKKEQKEQDEMDEFKDYVDKVEFGEVAHEPPQLKARPRKADATHSAKPGKKDLLLNSLFTKSDNTQLASKKARTIDRTGKRKNLPVGERRQLEKQQSAIVAAYRRLKAQRAADADS